MKRLQSHQDAFGRALLDHLEGRGGVEIVERRDGYISADRMGKYFAPATEWEGHERLAAERIRGRLLAVGCGAGRFLLHAQEQSIPCVGIDRSPLAVEVCRRRGVKAVHEISIEHVSAGLGEFDTLLLMGYNFGLFGSASKARWLLRRFHAMTPVDAQVIAATRDPYRTENPVHLEYQDENRRKGRMPGQERLRIRYGSYRTPWFDFLFVSVEEFERLASGASWRFSVADEIQIRSSPSGSTSGALARSSS